MQHVFFVPTRHGQSMAAQLMAAAQWLKEHDDFARRMGRTGQELVSRVLTPNNVLEYWRRLIVQYAALQVGGLGKHANCGCVGGWVKQGGAGGGVSLRNEGRCRIPCRQ